MVKDIDPTRVEISGTYTYQSDLDAIYVLVGGSSDMADASAFESVLNGRNFTATVTGLKENTNYYYRYRFVGTDTEQESEAVRSFTTLDPYNGHEYVDLGLPSGTLWATCNVGADKPEDYGDYFAWGETTTKNTYSLNTYRWCNGSYDNLTKYCTDGSYGTVDNKTVLEPSDDAAYVNWGGGWRMPTRDEMEELMSDCNRTWTTMNGVSGYRFDNKNDNNKFIFLPVAGFYSDGNLLNAGSYWSSSLHTDYQVDAYNLYFSSGGVGMSSSFRFYGRSVRPVIAPRK